MPALHLGDEIVGDVGGGELAEFQAELQLPGEVQHQVGDLLADRRRVAIGGGGVEFVRLLHQVGADRLAGLHPVPFTALPEIGHHRDGPVQWRISLHRLLRGPSLRPCEIV